MPNIYNNSVVALGGSIKDLFDTKKSMYYEFYNQKDMTYEQLEKILRYDDTSNVINMESAFSGCNNLTSIPLLDTSNVTTLRDTFFNCHNLTTLPLLNTSNVVMMYNTFYNCHRLNTLPLLDTSKVTNMNDTFGNCNDLISIPQLDTSNVESMNNTFGGCSSLETIPQLDVSKVTSMRSIFYRCENLTSILMYGMNTSFDISASTKFTREALVTVINNLATVTSTKILTMGSTNLDKLTDEDKSIATNKGWTLK